jgi:transcriptional regulator with XRE-family HTH domain
MKLADFLFQTGMTTTQLRRALGLASRSTITRYLHGERVPTPQILQQIIELTGGRVQLRDFLSPGNPECATIITLPNGRRRLVFPWASRESELAAANDVEIARAIEQDNLSEPLQRAVKALAGRAQRLPNGAWSLDGRPSDIRRVVLEANRRLREIGQPVIEYPGIGEA